MPNEAFDVVYFERIGSEILDSNDWLKFGQSKLKKQGILAFDVYQISPSNWDLNKIGLNAKLRDAHPRDLILLNQELLTLENSKDIESFRKTGKEIKQLKEEIQSEWKNIAAKKEFEKT